MERTRNASRNILLGTISKIITLLVPFAVRTILIRVLGVEYIGLGSLFTSILQVLNLAELGISSAIVFSMYGAIASNDDSLICQLLALYKKVYRIIGIIVLIAGCVVAPFLGFLISGDVPADVNIYLLYFVYLLNTCLSYFLFAYKSCLFTAHQRNDVVSKIGILVSLSTYTLQVVLLLLFKNYYLYIVVLPVMTIANNLLISFVSSKKYPNYHAEGSVPDDIKNDLKKKVYSLFLYKIGGVVLTSVDTIVISAFLGLTALGKYNNYYYIITALFGFLDVFYASMTAGVGNSIKTETKEKNKKDFNRLLLIQGWLISWCAVCLLCLYQPFMRLWVGEELMFPFTVVICLVILFFVWKMMDVVNMFKNAAGLWEYDKWRQLVASAFNLTLNLVLVHFIGIYGIIVSTIASIVIVIFPWSTFVLFKYYFNDGNYKKEFAIYVSKIIRFVLIASLVGLATFFVCKLIPDISIGYFFAKIGICITLPTLLLFCFFCFFRDFKETELWLIARIKIVFKKK